MLGRVLRPHGVAGKVKVLVQVEPASFDPSFIWLARDGAERVPYEVVGRQLSGRFVLFRLKDVSSLEQAKSLCGMKVYVPSSCEASIFPFDEEELVGMALYDGGHLVGSVTHFHNYGGNRLLGVEIEGREVLIPAHRSILLRIDKENKTIHAQLPTGLLDP